MVGSPFIFTSESEIHQFDVFVLVEEDVLELQVTVDARVFVNIGDGTDKLGENLLDFG